MGWRSRETAHHMTVKFRRNNSGAVAPVREAEPGVDIGRIERRMGSLADKATAANGDIDIGLLTGDEALRYFDAMGVHLGRTFTSG